MSNKAELYMLKGMISDMDELDQDMIASYQTSIKDILKEGGEHAVLALTLVALEIPDEGE
jgi:hypothetical protein